jgi:hypothetical protein
MELDEATIGKNLSQSSLATLLALDFFISRGATTVAVGMLIHHSSMVDISHMSILLR